MSNRRIQHVPQPPRLQGKHPAFIEAAAKMAAIAIDPKYEHAAARRRRGISSAQWKVLEDEWKCERRRVGRRVSGDPIVADYVVSMSGGRVA